MKKLLCVMLATVMLFTLCSCGGKKTARSKNDGEPKEEVKPFSFADTIEKLKEEYEEKDSDIYDVLCGSCIIVAEDGSYLKVDCQEYEYDDTEVVEILNKEFGFGDVLMQKMYETRALDGTRTDENENFKVSWTYHPDEDLDVIYERKSNTDSSPNEASQK